MYRGEPGGVKDGLHEDSWKSAVGGIDARPATYKTFASVKTFYTVRVFRTHIEQGPDLDA